MVMMQGNLHGQRRNLFAKATSLAHSNVTQCLGRFMGIIDHNPSLFCFVFLSFVFFFQIQMVTCCESFGSSLPI